MSGIPGISKSVVPTWALDYACKKCRRYGCIQIGIAGGPMVEGRPMPDTDDAALARKLYNAHRRVCQDGCNLPSGDGHKMCVGNFVLGPPGENGCTGSVGSRDILLGEMWRHGRAGVEPHRVFLERKDSRLVQRGTYKWPPWVE